MDDPRSPDVRRSVGEAVTTSKRLRGRVVRAEQPGGLRRRGIAPGNALRDQDQRPARDPEHLPGRFLGQPPLLRREGDPARFDREPVHGQRPAQGRDDGGRLEGARADPEPEDELPLRAPERGPGRAWPARSAAGPASRAAVGQPGGQSVHRAGRAGPGRGPAADPDPLERRAGQRLRGRPACRADHREDLGPARRGDHPPGGPVPVRSPGAGTDCPTRPRANQAEGARP